MKGLGIIMLFVITLSGLTHGLESNTIRLTTVFDNTRLNSETTSEWGFACVIEHPQETLLFDTGNDGQILQQNLKVLGFNQVSFSKIIISHMHWDHYGGLETMMDANPNATVYVPASAKMLKDSTVLECCKNLVHVDQPVKIIDHVYSSGELDGPVNEQSLVITTSNGLVVVTGCAHPGIVKIAEAARDQFPDVQTIDLLMGGFHLMRHAEAQVMEIIQELRVLNVKNVSPTHCTGEKAIDLFQQQFGDHFMKPGIGFQVDFSWVD